MFASPEQKTPKFQGGRVHVLVGDITRQDVGAIVNAANSTLLGGGGVDGAIHRAGGPAILEECRGIRQKRFPKGLPAGEAVITTGGLLVAPFVIHTVGPIWGRHEGREAEVLASCYRSSLALAVEQQLSSIAFPAISTGAYGYPRVEAARTASASIAEFLARYGFIEEVRMVFFSSSDAQVFLNNHRFNN